jgi:DNA repair exonuclease SbcCD ATPase subunit
MSDPVAFKWVEIAGFRGFNQRQRIVLDASAVIVIGPNGTGKTSFFDALQWLLLGTLQRLERWRVRKNDEHIVNLYRSSEPAVVEAELVIRAHHVRLRRQGRYDEGILELHDENGSLHGDKAEERLAEMLRSRPGQDVRRLLMSSALLQQDVVREVLEDKPSERYQHLAGLLGLDELGQFETEVKKRADRLANAGKEGRASFEAAQTRAEGLRARVSALENDMRLAADVRAAREEIVKRLTTVGSLVVLDPIPNTSAEAALAQTATQASGEQLAEFARRRRELDDKRKDNRPHDEAALASQTAALSIAESAFAVAEQEARDAERALAEATERSSQMAALAANAIQLLGETCPVCGQDIDQHDVERHLQERITNRGDASLSAAMQGVEAARSRTQLASVEVQRCRDALAPLLAAKRQADEYATAERQLSGELETADLSLGASLRLVEVDAIRAGDLQRLEETVAALRVAWRAAADLVAVLRSDSSDARLAAEAADLRRAEEAIISFRASAMAVSEQEEKAKLLHRAATRAVAGVTSARFRRLLPTVQDIYWRLDPHPSFTTFDFELDVYRLRGIATPIVRDVDGSVAGDPLLLFSSSQANVVALSYFLALGWAAGADALPFVLLDDPLQSMDDVNALGFADLCRHVRRQRQLVVSTHERRLGALLQRKLAPRLDGERTRLIEFKAWTRDGPVIQQSEVAPQVEEGAQRSVVTANAA